MAKVWGWAGAVAIALAWVVAASTAGATALKVEFTEPIGTVIDDNASWVVVRARFTNLSADPFDLGRANSSGSILGPSPNWYDLYSYGTYWTSYTPVLAPGEVLEAEWTRLAPRSFVPNGTYIIDNIYIAFEGDPDVIYGSNTFEWTVADSRYEASVAEPSALLTILPGLYLLFKSRIRGRARMKSMVCACCVIASMALAGCAGSPASMLFITEQNIKSMPDLDVCGAYGYSSGHTAIVKAELERRNLIAAGNWPLVEAKQLAIGIDTCTLFASQGKPTYYGSTNRLRSPLGEFVTYTYRDPRFGGGYTTKAVTTVNGMVTTIVE